VTQRSRFLRWPSDDELCSSDAQLCLSIVIALVNVARAVIFRFHNARHILCSTKLSRRIEKPRTLPECYQRCYSAGQCWFATATQARWDQGLSSADKFQDAISAVLEKLLQKIPQSGKFSIMFDEFHDAMSNVLKKLLQKIRQSGKFSIMFDEFHDAMSNLWCPSKASQSLTATTRLPYTRPCEWRCVPILKYRYNYNSFI